MRKKMPFQLPFLLQNHPNFFYERKFIHQVFQEKAKTVPRKNNLAWFYRILFGLQIVPQAKYGDMRFEHIECISWSFNQALSKFLKFCFYSTQIERNLIQPILT